MAGSPGAGRCFASEYALRPRPRRREPTPTTQHRATNPSTRYSSGVTPGRCIGPISSMISYGASALPKHTYGREKREKELRRQRKREEKQQRKLDRAAARAAQPNAAGSGAPGAPPADSAST